SSAPANNAPTLTSNGNANLTGIGEDNVKSAGDTVAQILGTSFFDADPGARQGIAVTGLTGTGSGRWMYSTNGGKAWKPVGAVSEANALLLGAGDKVRFEPAANFSTNSSDDVGITYRGWDRTRGSAGGRADLSVVGAADPASPFSTASQTA